jgi:3'-5' exoribonuclease
MSIAMRMVSDKLRNLPDFPPLVRTLVEHMILSHHGRLEFGSPKVPQFPEALLLHHLDDMDSKMECMRALIENDRQVDGCFTTYHPAMERSALKKDRYLHAPAAEPKASAAPVSAPGPARSTVVEQPAFAGSKGNSLLAEKLMQAGLVRPKQEN